MSRYDPFRHLYKSLFASKSDLFAMITAYFDDSGTSAQNDVAAVGGYLATTYQWDRFIPRWKQLLKDYDVKQMHRTDLETWKREFTEDRGWGPTRRKKFISRAQEIIKQHTYVAVGSAVIKKDFEEVLPLPVRKFFGGAYGWCAHECIIAAGMWCEKSKHNEPIDWVFEKGTVGSGQIQFYFNKCSETSDLTKMTRVQPGGWSFYGKDVIPLQAADVMAYEIFKQVKNQIVDRGRKKIRLSALDLFRAKDVPYLQYWDKDRLHGWLNEPGLQPFISVITRYMNSRTQRR